MCLQSSDMALHLGDLAHLSIDDAISQLANF
jgi:hypothetical protein